MLQNRSSPATDPAGTLGRDGPDSQPPASDLEDRAPDVDRVHLLVFPDPDEGVPEDVLDIIGQGQSRDPLAHERVAITDRHELLALQRHEEQLDQLLPRIAGTLLPNSLHLAEEFVVHGPHEWHLYAPPTLAACPSHKPLVVCSVGRPGSRPRQPSCFGRRISVILTPSVS